MFSRTMLALLLIGGLVAAALVFGRQYLFPTEWDQSLTPIVDDIQKEHGVEFDHTVGPRQSSRRPTTRSRPGGSSSTTVGWRRSRCGGRSGSPPVSRQRRHRTPRRRRRLAVYDPDADRIYMSAGASEAAAVDLRLALE